MIFFSSPRILTKRKPNTIGTRTLGGPTRPKVTFSAHRLRFFIYLGNLAFFHPKKTEFCRHLGLGSRIPFHYLFGAHHCSNGSRVSSLGTPGPFTGPGRRFLLRLHSTDVKAGPSGTLSDEDPAILLRNSTTQVFLLLSC